RDRAAAIDHEHAHRALDEHDVEPAAVAWEPRETVFEARDSQVDLPDGLWEVVVDPEPVLLLAAKAVRVELLELIAHRASDETRPLLLGCIAEPSRARLRIAAKHLVYLLAAHQGRAPLE